MRINWQQVVSFLIGAAIVLIILFALGIFPTHVNYCYENEASHKECGAYNIGLVAFWQIGKELNWIAPALGAIATIAVAIFTGTLWLSSKKMWEVTKKSVDIAERSLTELERPYLFILDYNWLLSQKEG